MRVFFALLTLLTLVACSDDSRRTPGRDGGPDAPPTEDMTTTDTPVDRGPSPCTAGAPTCDGNLFFVCGADGMTREDVRTCDQACDPSRGCVTCIPGTRTCDGDRSMVCNSTGTGFATARDCAESGSTCGAGFCTDACGFAESSRSNVGCEYWPVPLANAVDQGVFDYRVVVANPNDDTATVRISRGGAVVAQADVPPGGLQEIELDWIAGTSTSVGGADANWSSQITPDGAYRLVSTLPVTVSQFSPFEYQRGGDFSFSNDASLLLPAHSFTGDYIVSSFVPLSRRDPGLFGDTYIKIPGYLVVVGVTPEPTTVQVNVSANVAADASGRFPATPRGATLSFTLTQGEVAKIYAAPAPDCQPGRPGYVENDVGLGFCNETDADLTASRVASDNPVAVFGGHECAYVPYDREACDHLENQLPPLQTWGIEYIGGPLQDAGDRDAVNLVRIMAAFDGTEVRVDPPLEGTSNFTLGLGQWREFRTTEAFSVSSTRGVLVTQFLAGQVSDPPADRGDPAMVVLPPTQQYRSDYTFVAPSSYNATTEGQNYILVVRSPGQAISLDGIPVGGSFQSVGSREWAVVPIDGGTHQMESTQPFGVISYGLGQFTSYAYPAGLNLEEILLL